MGERFSPIEALGLRIRRWACRCQMDLGQDRAALMRLLPVNRASGSGLLRAVMRYRIDPNRVPNCEIKGDYGRTDVHYRRNRLHREATTHARCRRGVFHKWVPVALSMPPVAKVRRLSTYHNRGRGAPRLNGHLLLALGEHGPARGRHSPALRPGQPGRLYA